MELKGRVHQELLSRLNLDRLTQISRADAEPEIRNVIAGILEFIPTIGPILSAVPGVAMGFLDSPQKALSVGVAYLVIQQLEGHLLIPMLMKEGMDLPPALTIIANALRVGDHLLERLGASQFAGTERYLAHNIAENDAAMVQA